MLSRFQWTSNANHLIISTIYWAYIFTVLVISGMKQKHINNNKKNETSATEKYAHWIIWKEKSSERTMNWNVDVMENHIKTAEKNVNNWEREKKRRKQNIHKKTRMEIIYMRFWNAGNECGRRITCFCFAQFLKSKCLARA